MRKQYRFEEFLLGANERRLFRTPLEPVDLSGKPFDLLLYLVERPNTLLTRSELIDAVWGQVNVSDQSLTEAISRLRKTLDPTRPERFIQTVAGKGYRFVAAVAAVAAVDEGLGNPTEGPKRRRARAVLYAACSTFVICLGVAAWFASRPEREAHGLFENARLVERIGDDALAEDKLRQALRLNPAYDAATLRLAWILYQDDQDEEATRLLQSVKGKPTTGRFTQSPVQQKVEALQAMILGDTEFAQRLLKLALDADPKSTETLEFLAENEENRQQFESALVHASGCLQLDPRDSICRYQKAEMLIRKNDFEEALAQSTMSDGAVPPYPWLHEVRGYAALGLGRLDTAKQEFVALRDAGEKFANAVHFRASQEGLAQIQLLQLNYDEAHRLIEDAEQRSNSSSEKSEYELYLAGIDIFRGDVLEVARHVNVACGSTGCPAQQGNTVGRLLAAAGALLGAEQQMKALEAGPLSGSEETVATRRFIAGNQALVKHNSKDAVADLLEAVRLDPDPMIMFALAKTRLASGDAIAARDAAQQILNHKGSTFLGSYSCLIPLAQGILIGRPVGQIGENHK